MPMHGPHAHSSRRAPLARMSVSAPQSESMVSTCFDPGEMDRLTPGAMVLPLSRAATLSISSSDEFVHEPMQTWSTFVPASVATGTTLSGLCGQAIMGCSVLRSMSMTRL